jgi:hypothetical protein
MTSQRNIAMALVCLKVASSILITYLSLSYWYTTALEINFPIYAFVSISKMLMYYALFEISLRIKRNESTGAMTISMHGDNDHTSDILVFDHFAVAGVSKLCLIAM